MAKNSLTYLITISIISLFISISCSSSAITNKFHETILEDPYWTKSVYDATTNNSVAFHECIGNCSMRNEHDAVTKRRECIKECVRIECQRRYPNKKEMRESCIDFLDSVFGMYLR
ncbi:hypothetical protein PIB30_020520 [Stylosanthes scabra]|uniref:Uncharacterized protein n=1 Tax=Stylosanthes scabra TaxID=79078 RepID=A0ABU6Y6S9_9FABA|nr:hypothetical protein [Stylosanthes scabra]